MSKLFTTLALTAALGATLAAAEPAALDQQNGFVKTHCAVCHNDRANNGGLSLEGFDAAVAPPSLAAMMLNKMTSGTALATVHAASHGDAAAAALDKGVKNGAMGAAGIGVPDRTLRTDWLRRSRPRRTARRSGPSRGRRCARPARK